MIEDSCNASKSLNCSDTRVKWGAIIPMSPRVMGVSSQMNTSGEVQLEIGSLVNNVFAPTFDLI